MGSAHSLYDLTYALPLRMGFRPFPWRNAEPFPLWIHADATWSALTWALLAWFFGGAHGRIGWFVHLLQRVLRVGGTDSLHFAALAVSAVLNPFAACVLTGFSVFQ
eukprot:471732-Prymnesium_polylepis.2